MLASQWRSSEGNDVVIVVDDDGAVASVIPASPRVLSRFLSSANGFDTGGPGLAGEQPPKGQVDPESWGRLVIARGDYGQVLAIDPELYWDGIYFWFRSRGVDYDAPQPEHLRPTPDRAR